MSKMSLHLAGGISSLCLIALNTSSVLAESSTPATASAASTPVTASAIAQTAPTNNLENPLTSVSQLADVQPTDWAYGALQSLIERYGVIASYPNRTFRGDRPLTRYEFAAGLNAVLDRVNELIATRAGSQVFREDLVTLERLQREYTAELATVRSRIDDLEARTAKLEANQFSTTTKLSGQVIFALNAGGFNGEQIVDPTGAEITDEQPSATLTYRAAIDFNTSFSGTDLLKLRLDTVPAFGDDNAAGFLEPNFGSVLEFSVRGTPDQIGLARAYYTFTPFQNLSLTVGPRLVTTDFVDLNSYANGNGGDFATLALVNNLLLFPIFSPSPGAVLDWNPGQGPFQLRVLYAAADGANPSFSNQIVGILPLTALLYPDGGGNRGLFGDPYQSTVELEYSPAEAVAVRIQYSGGNVFDEQFDAFGVNFELRLSRQLGVFGRYGYGSFNDTVFGNIEPNYWMVGVGFRDLFLPGAIAGIATGQPFIDTAVGNATQTNIEAFYNFPLTDSFRITPIVQVITNPANQAENSTIFTGTLRTVFSF